MGVFILCIDLVLKWFALVASTSTVGLSYNSGSLVTEDRARLLLWLQTPGAAKCHLLGFVTIPVTS